MIREMTARERVLFAEDVLDLLMKAPGERLCVSDMIAGLRGSTALTNRGCDGPKSGRRWRFEGLAHMESLLEEVGCTIARGKTERGRVARFVTIGGGS